MQFDYQGTAFISFFYLSKYYIMQKYNEVLEKQKLLLQWEKLESQVLTFLAFIYPGFNLKTLSSRKKKEKKKTNTVLPDRQRQVFSGNHYLICSLMQITS